jgi:hypothetical protein
VINNKEPYILITHYQNLYKNKYGRVPSINKFREKWGMQDVIDTVGFNRAKELLDYYFTTSKYGHPIQFFLYNFDKIDQINREVEKDKVNRKVLREATKKLVEEGEE